MMPAVVSSPYVEQAKKPLPSALYVVIIGIVVTIIGGVVYAVAWTQTMDDIWNDPNFPDTGSIDSMFGLMMVSYVIMSLGTVILFIGLILLVIHE